MFSKTAMGPKAVMEDKDPTPTSMRRTPTIAGSQLSEPTEVGQLPDPSVVLKAESDQQ